MVAATNEPEPTTEGGPNIHTTAGKLAELERRRDEAVHAGSQRAVEKQHSRGKATARERVEMLLDPDSFVEIDELARHRSTNFGLDRTRPYSGVRRGDVSHQRQGRAAVWGGLKDRSVRRIRIGEADPTPTSSGPNGSADRSSAGERRRRRMTLSRGCGAGTRRGRRVAECRAPQCATRSPRRSRPRRC